MRPLARKGAGRLMLGGGCGAETRVDGRREPRRLLGAESPGRGNSKRKGPEGGECLAHPEAG